MIVIMFWRSVGQSASQAWGLPSRCSSSPKQARGSRRRRGHPRARPFRAKPPPCRASLTQPHASLSAGERTDHVLPTSGIVMVAAERTSDYRASLMAGASEDATVLRRDALVAGGEPWSRVAVLAPVLAVVLGALYGQTLHRHQHLANQ